MKTLPSKATRRLEDQLNEARLEDKWEADRAHRVWLGQFEN